VGERTELAINIGATGLAAYVGYQTQGLAGAEIAAIVPAYVSGLFAMREKNLVTVTEDAIDLAGMDGADLVAWIQDDERHAAFFTEALETAWSTLDRHKLRTLSCVLAEGFQDDARLDIDQLVVKALRALDPPHVRVLDVMAKEEGIPILEPGGSFQPDPAAPIGIELSRVRKALPELNDGFDAIIAGLERTGCIGRSERAMFGGNQPLVVTDFGRTCLDALRKADPGAELAE
jgi:hypothetical protein